MRWDKVGAGAVYAAAMASLLAPTYAERKTMDYYGYQDITESGYEPVTYQVTNTVKQSRGWPSVALVVPIVWAIVVLILILVLL
jgi:hypothetical protein